MNERKVQMSQRRRQIEERLELRRRVDGTIQQLMGWRDALPYDIPADTSTLFNEARSLLERLRALIDRDVDAAITPGAAEPPAAAPAPPQGSH